MAICHAANQLLAAAAVGPLQPPPSEPYLLETNVVEAQVRVPFVGVLEVKPVQLVLRHGALALEVRDGYTDVVPVGRAGLHRRLRGGQGQGRPVAETWDASANTLSVYGAPMCACWDLRNSQLACV